MEFRVLGPLEVVDGDRPVELGGRRQRALLACLLVHANEVVAAERLIEGLWGGRGGANALQVAMSRLRGALGEDECLLTQPPGYVLRLGLGEYDRDEFERLTADARYALEYGRPESAAATFRDALGLWRGAPFADFLYEPFAQAEIARLEEARLACLEERIEADLALGRHGELVGELEALTKVHPLRERVGGQLMLALYRSGRQADALAVYQAARRRLVEELGLEPSDELRALEQAILRHDPQLKPPSSPAATAVMPDTPASVQPAPAIIPTATRKTVTVLVAGTSELAPAHQDPELRRQLSSRFFQRVAPVLERHGAAIERLRDDRIMGVLGVPVAHEDDALRAIRAAVELREALAEGNPPCIGIDTGEVLTGDPALGERLVAGGAVDRAALLQQSSQAGGIVITDATRSLVRDAVRVEPGEADVAGAAWPPVWRLLELVLDAPAFQRRFDAPLVGREGELAQLRQAFERARRERRAQLFTVFGEAGIGKTRLAQELARSVDGEARMLTGRCLSYGEGITYGPLREIAEQAEGDRSLRELLVDSPDADVVAARLESAIGSGTGGAVNEEVFWAVRKLVEALARETPLVLVFEDVHWAEPTLLDLVEHLADWVRDAPVLIVCLARPELLDGRPRWGGGKLNATSILLEPLSREESSRLIEILSVGAELTREAWARIADVSQGNPLFLEQMLAMLAQGEDEVGEIAVPPAIQALLAARLDRLEPEERRLLERASIEGETFHVGGVVELSPPEAREAVASTLTSLVRKELIRAERTTLPGEEAFRFRHALIRDAAYEGSSKEARSELHERHAAWIERTLGDRVREAEEILGYHLEQAHRFCAELGFDDEHTLELADRARLRLGSAGRLAFRRGDTRAAINLLERARSLPSVDERARLELAPDLGFALFEAGELERAESVLSSAIDRARAIGERHGERHAWLVREFSRLFAQPDLIDVAESLRDAEESLEVLEPTGDNLALTRVYRLLAALHACGDAVRERDAAERALEHARRAGSRPDETWSLGFLGYILLQGPTSAGEGVLICERLLSELVSDPRGQATVRSFLASFLAMQSRFDDARALIASSRAALQEFSGPLMSPLELYGTGYVETLTGDLPAAERAFRAAAENSATIVDRWFYVIALIDLARTVCNEGRANESLRILDESERYPSFPDLEIVVKRPAARGLALAQLGRLDQAETFAREAVGHADGTEFLAFHAEALVTLAEVLRLAGRREQAARELEKAVGLYERKGNVVSAAKARAILESTTAAS